MTCVVVYIHPSPNFLIKTNINNLPKKKKKKQTNSGMLNYFNLDFSKIQAAKLADYTLLFLGIDNTVESEMHDRINITLPGVQDQLAQEIVANILINKK